MFWAVAACGAPELKFLERPEGPTDEALPLIVTLHGYGDVAESQLELVESCGLPARIVAPRGPKKHPSGEGAAWYPITFTAEGPTRDVGAVLDATDRLARFVQEYTAERQATKVVVTGFSQGGILSFSLATRYPKLVDAAVPVAGVVPEVVPAKDGAPRIRALHGAEDPLLPAAETEARVQELAAAGWDASIRVFPGVEHQIPPVVQEALCSELRAAIGP